MSRSGVLKGNRGGPRGNSFVVVTDEPVDFLTKAWEILVRPEASYGVFNVVLNWMGKVVRTVMPEGENHQMRFVGVTLDLLKWLKEAEGGKDDNVIGDDYEIGFLTPPLEVVFSSYLDGGRKSKGEGYNGLVVGDVEELSGSKAFVLKGSKLSVKPPVL